MLGLAVDDAGLDQRQHAVGEHLGVDTQILVTHQLRQHGVRNGADAHLQRGAVLDQFGAVAADAGLDLVGLGEVRLDERLVVLHEGVDLRHRDHRLTERTGHVLVDDGDHVVGHLDGAQRSVDRGAERYVAVLVRGRHLNHRHVAGYGSATVEALRLAQEDRNVVGIAALGILADVGAHEEGVELEDAVELLGSIGCRALGVEVVDMYVPEFAGTSAAAHGLDQTLRCRCHGAQMHVVAGLDDLDGFVR